MRRWSVMGAALVAATGGCFWSARKAGPVQNAPSSRELAASLSDQGGSMVSTSESLAAQAAPIPIRVLGKDARLGCTWVEAGATVEYPGDETRDQVRAQAISQAENEAMTGFLGVTARSRTMVFAQEGFGQDKTLVENVLRTTRSGRILNEKVVSEGSTKGGAAGFRYAATVQDCIVPIPSYHDANFRVDLWLSRQQAQAGDSFQVRLTCSENCFVYLYDVEDDWKTTLLVPDAQLNLTQVPLKAASPWIFPDPSLANEGVSLVAELPKGKIFSAETIRVIATKTPMTADMSDPSKGGYLGVVRRLNRAAIDWSEDTQALTIRLPPKQ
jgi:hypothetical protein